MKAKEFFLEQAELGRTHTEPIFRKLMLCLAGEVSDKVILTPESRSKIFLLVAQTSEVFNAIKSQK